MKLSKSIFLKITKSLTLLSLTFALNVTIPVSADETNYAHSLTRLPSRYNITACHSHKFIWFRVAKVGTRTILNILQNNFPLTVNDYSVPYNAKEYEGFFKFAFVRNPWSRIVSCYHNKVVLKCYPAFEECYDKDFNFFVDFINRCDVFYGDPHIKLQTRLFPVNDVDFIGRLENFEEDLKFVLGVLNIDEVSIDHRNSSKHDHYSRYYNERTKNIIAKKYSADIKAFGYQFEYE